VTILLSDAEEGAGSSPAAPTTRVLTISRPEERSAHTLEFEGFLVGLRVQGCSTRTVDNRKRVLQHLRVWIGSNDDLTFLTRPRVVAFLEDLRAQGRRPLTLRTYAVIVHTFLKWCVGSGLLHIDPLQDFTILFGGNASIPRTLFVPRGFETVFLGNSAGPTC